MTDQDTACGVPVPPLPEGWTALEVCVVVKALDEEGRVRLASRYSAGLNSWEALGMLITEGASLKDQLVRSFRGEEE